MAKSGDSTKSSDPVGMKAARLDVAGDGPWPEGAMAREMHKDKMMKVALISLLCVFTAPFLHLNWSSF